MLDTLRDVWPLVVLVLLPPLVVVLIVERRRKTMTLRNPPAPRIG